MRFTVTWGPIAQRKLASIWINNPSRRNRVTQAASEVDRILRDDPQDKGRPYDGDRILEIPPLTAIFTVKEDDRIVEVVEIRLRFH